MNPRIQRLHRRFAASGPKARYLGAALVLEGSLVAMSFLIPGSGAIQASRLSQGLQIETARQEIAESIPEDPAEPVLLPVEENIQERTEVELTRFHVLDQEPLPMELLLASTPPQSPLQEDSEPEVRPDVWLHRILKRPQQKPLPASKTPSQASTARVRLEPLEGQCPKPRYPAAAVRLGLEGSIRFKIHVTISGRVESLEIVKQDCPQVLLRAAQKALRHWRFHGGPGIYEKHVVFCLIQRQQD